MKPEGQKTPRQRGDDDQREGMPTCWRVADLPNVSVSKKMGRWDKPNMLKDYRVGHHGDRMYRRLHAVHFVVASDPFQQAKLLPRRLPTES